MSVSDRILDALRDTVLLNDRVTRLGVVAEELRAGQQALRDRVTRIEALIEFANNAQAAARKLAPPQA